MSRLSFPLHAILPCAARVALAACVSVVISRAPARATMTVQLGLQQVVAAADRAFVGRVASVRSDRDDAGLPSTWVTFAVSRTIKGSIGHTVTIKQIGAATPLPDGTTLRLPGLPSYTPGEEMVIFLSGESSAGFCSPIGLMQGKFPIVRRAGQAMVSATAENVGVLQAMRRTQAAHAPTAEIPLTDFLDQVTQLLAGGTRQ